MDNKLLTHFFFGEKKKSRNTGDDGEQFWDSFLHEGERQQDNTKRFQNINKFEEWVLPTYILAISTNKSAYYIGLILTSWFERYENFYFQF